MRHIAAAGWEFIDDLKYEQEHKELFAPIALQIKQLDKSIGGIRGGAYWAIGGGAKVGKSTFEVHLAMRLAEAGRGKVAIFGLEEIDLQIAARLLVMNPNTNNVTRSEIYRLDVSEDGFLDLQEACEILESFDFYVEDSVFTMDEIIRICEAKNISFAFIDYMGLLNDQAGRSEAERLAAISRKVVEARNRNKKTAKAKGVAPITLVMIYQLNEKNTAFGTNALYKDADAILELYPAEDSNGEPILGQIDIKVLPSRIVKATKTVRATLDGDHSRIVDIEVFDFKDINLLEDNNGPTIGRYEQGQFEDPDYETGDYDQEGR